jgi:hypothetical protein
VSNSSKRVGSDPRKIRENRRPPSGSQWPANKPQPSSEPIKRATTLCESVPELGALPYPTDRAPHRKVIRLVSADDGDLSIDLMQGLNRIGRQRQDNHIVLVSPKVSRFHAEIELGPQDILIRDLKSANGTFINGERIVGARKLQAGDRVSFSDQFTLRLLIDMALIDPESVTLARDEKNIPLPEADAKPPPLLNNESVPHSLRERTAELMQVELERHQAANVKGMPLPSPPPPMPIPPGPSVADEPMETMHDMSPVNVHAPPPPPPLPPPPAADPGDVSQTEKERRHLAVLYQICKRCMSVDNLNDLDALLLNVLERTVPFDRGFISYQLPTGDWKLVMSPKGDRWERELIQQLLVAAFASDAPVSIPDSHHDQRLGAPNGSADSRLLVPLRSGTSPIGTIFLLSTDVDGFANDSAEFLVLFADVAALAILNCARFSGE